MSKQPTSQSIGKDTIYICQTCQNREKEFALPDRNHKYCGKCSNVSVKSTFVDSYNFVQGQLVLDRTSGEVDGSSN